MLQVLFGAKSISESTSDFDIRVFETSARKEHTVLARFWRSLVERCAFFPGLGGFKEAKGVLDSQKKDLEIH